MLIFIQRGTSVPFFLRFFRGAAESPPVTLSEGEESSRTLFVAFRRCLNAKQFAE